MNLLEHLYEWQETDCLKNRLKTVAAELGFEHFAYFGGTIKPGTLGQDDMWTAPPTFIDELPDDWGQIYHENRYDKTDPIMRRAFQRPVPFLWDRDKGGFARQAFFRTSADFGIARGITIPIVHGLSEIGLATFVSSERSNVLERHAQGAIEGLLLTTQLVHEFSLKSQRDTQQQELGLTPREREVLQWVCVGKTNAEVGEILSLNEQSVVNYVYRLSSKFGVYNRTQLAYRAMTLGLIQL